MKKNPITLVTGGTGLLGRAFLQAHSHWIGVKRPGSISSLSNSFIECDYSPNSVSDFLNTHGPIADIVHCAGVPAVFASLRNPVQDHYNNFDSFLFTLELARQGGASITLASSAEVYGSQLNRIEDSPRQPENFYGLSKVFCEDYLKMYHDKFGVKFRILRPSILFDSGLKRNVLFDLLSGFKEKKSVVKLFCTLDSELDFIHSSEVVGAHSFLCENDLANDVWNVANGRSVRVSDLFDWFCTCFSFSPSIEIVEHNFQKKVLPTNKLRDLGWAPNKDFFSHLQQWVQEDLKS